MPEEVREAVFGNVGTIVSFRVGASDAPYLAKEYAPVFEETDLVNLDKYHIYVKMAIDGITSPAFSAITLPPAPNMVGLKQQIIEYSREKYSRPRTKVEQEIWDQSREEEAGPSHEAPREIQSSSPAEPGPKLKGPSAVIRVGDRKFAEFTTRDGERWYQEQESTPEDNTGSSSLMEALQRPPDAPKRSEELNIHPDNKPEPQASTEPQNTSNVNTLSSDEHNDLEEGKMIDL